MLMHLLSVLILAAGVVSAAADWPQFRGNPRLTGVAAGNVPAAMKLIWTYEAGAPIESSAAISGGTVYVGSEPGDLLAVDLQTGKLKWKYRASDSIGESSPAVAAGTVYIGDLGGVLHAVDAATGKGLWMFKTEGEIRSSSLYCLSRRDGKLLWKVETGNFVHATPAVADGVTYFSGCDETVHGIRLADGQEIVTFPSGGYTGASMVLVDKRAYYGTFDNSVVGVDLVKQAVLWRYSPGGFPFYSSAAFGGDRIVVGGRDRLVHAIGIETGKAIWTFRTRARVDSSPPQARGRG